VPDFGQNAVVNYLRANRSIYTNTEYCLSLDHGKMLSKRYWHSDVLVVAFHVKTIFLTEISFAKPPSLLMKRLQKWHNHWGEIPTLIIEDAKMDLPFPPWQVRPWIFVPKNQVPYIQKRLAQMFKVEQRFKPIITATEMVQPDRFNWRHVSEDPDQKKEAGILEQYWQ
jgi:hypothetical protein